MSIPKYSVHFAPATPNQYGFWRDPITETYTCYGLWRWVMGVEKV